MIPSRALIGLLAAWTALAVPATAWPALFRGPWAWSGLTLLGVALLDAVLARLQPPPALARSLPGTLAVGAWTEARLRLSAPGFLPLRLELWEGLPPSFESRGMPRRLRLAPGAWAELRYRLRPRERGAFRLSPCQARLGSPCGLWQRCLHLGGEGAVKVYPDFAAVKQYARLATGHRLGQLGIHRKRRRGEGTEFHQLREYREGDSPRQIDWKATSRMRRLVSREYTDERDQQVLILLECGRRMRAQDGPLSHFDHALSALLLLAHVALREGDAVGLLSFAGEERWLPPRKGSHVQDALAERLYDLQPTTRASDYLEAARSVLVRVRKRALVVLVTNLRDEDDDTLQPALALLRARHQVLVASLREQALEQALHGEVAGFEEALLQGAVHQYLDQRRATFERMAVRGVRTLDVLPERLSVALVNRYLDLKRSGAA